MSRRCSAPSHRMASFMIDADTVVSNGSGEAALRAAGALVDAVDAVVDGRARNAFCAVRPPGHHAEEARAMGFCLFNSVAVGAGPRPRCPRPRKGCGRRFRRPSRQRHPGHVLEPPGDVLRHRPISIPTFRGPGRPARRAAGTISSMPPLAPGSGSEAFRAAIEDRVIPALDAFRPEFLFLSAGFRWPRAGSACRHQSGGGRFRLGDGPVAGGRPRPCRRACCVGA